MQDYQKNIGKKTLFGNDKALRYYINYEEKLKELIYALILDGILDRNSTGEERLEKLVSAQYLFWKVFPGWDYAKKFFIATFIEGKREAIIHLGKIA